jgi:hypothetical protein
MKQASLVRFIIDRTLGTETSDLTHPRITTGLSSCLSFISLLPHTLGFGYISSHCGPAWWIRPLFLEGCHQSGSWRIHSDLFFLQTVLRQVRQQILSTLFLSKSSALSHQSNSMASLLDFFEHLTCNISFHRNYLQPVQIIDIVLSLSLSGKTISPTFTP